MKIYCHDCRCYGLDSNLTPPEYIYIECCLYTNLLGYSKWKQRETVRNKNTSCGAYLVQNSASLNDTINLSSDL
jgi:hypothetical protein